MSKRRSATCTQAALPSLIARLAELAGDSLLACSDGLWHYFTPQELGTIVDALPPREAAEMLINKARQRARGGGDNLSLALLRIDPMPRGTAVAASAAR